MEHKVVKRLPTTEVKAHFGQIVHEVATTGTPERAIEHGHRQSEAPSYPVYQSVPSYRRAHISREASS
jgi:hypothetical protein